jgi:membrane-associated protein
MNFEQLLTNGLGLVGAFTPRIAIFIFLVCFIVFETTWLVAGYQLSGGVLPVLDLILLMITAQLGRQGGALVLYLLSRRSTSFFERFIARRMRRKDPGDSGQFSFMKRIDTISPFGVALGRLMWLRIPLTLVLGARRKLKTLMLGVVISSLVYEGVYIALGAIVRKTTKPDSGYVLLYFAGGLAAIYVVTFGVRFLVKTVKRRIGPKTPPTAAPESSLQQLPPSGDS